MIELDKRTNYINQMYKDIKVHRVVFKEGKAPSKEIVKDMETFLKAFRTIGWKIKEASEAVGISTSQHHLWLRKYPEYEEAYELVLEERADFIEGSIFDAFDDPRMGVVAKIYASKAEPKMKKRGWGETQTHTLSIEDNRSKEEKDAILEAGMRSEKLGFRQKLLDEGVIEGEIVND